MVDRRREAENVVMHTHQVESNDRCDIYHLICDQSFWKFENCLCLPVLPATSFDHQSSMINFTKFKNCLHLPVLPTPNLDHQSCDQNFWEFENCLYLLVLPTP